MLILPIVAIIENRKKKKRGCRTDCICLLEMHTHTQKNGNSYK